MAKRMRQDCEEDTEEDNDRRKNRLHAHVI